MALCRLTLFMLLLLATYANPIYGQTYSAELDTSSIPYVDSRTGATKQHNNRFRFSVGGDLPPPTRRSPRSTREYFYNFGDGQFSEKPRPFHTYSQPGTYRAYAVSWLTYPDEEDEDERVIYQTEMIGIVVDSITTNSANEIYDIDNEICVKTNHDPIIEDSLTLIVQYKNRDSTTVNSGKIRLFFNDTQLDYQRQELYFGEAVSSVKIDTASGLKYLEWDFDKLKFNETRAIYVVFWVEDSLQGQPIFSLATYDTDSLLSTSDNCLSGGGGSGGGTLGIGPPGRAIDPNKKEELDLVTGSVISFPWTGDAQMGSDIGLSPPWSQSPISYRVSFENKGNAPAMYIRIIDDFSEIFDVTSLLMEGNITSAKGRRFNVYLDTLDRVLFNMASGEEPLKGYRQPNVSREEANDYITFIVGVKSYSPCDAIPMVGPRIKNKVSIIFNSEDPIVTNPVLHFTDQGNQQGNLVPTNLFNDDCITVEFGEMITLEPDNLPNFSNFNYQWNDGADIYFDPSYTFLASTNFTITLVLYEGCSPGSNYVLDTLCIIVPPCNNNDLLASITTTAVSCDQISDGTATISVSGGTPPYSYQWIRDGSSNTATDLHPGDYECIISDSKNCFIVEYFEIFKNEAPDPHLFKQNNLIYSNISGSNTIVSYEWNTGETTSAILVMSDNAYYLTVTDDQDCMGTASIYIPPAVPTLSQWGLFFLALLMMGIGVRVLG